jgi:hypothetical protein
MLDEDIEVEGGDEESGDSWFGSLRSNTRSIGSGGLFLIAILVLFWNEGYSQRHSEALSEIDDQVVLAPATTIDPALEGKPIHLSARVSSSGGAEDTHFGVRVAGPALYREVYMYQWIEYAETTGKGSKKKTTYHYVKDWDSEYHDSSQFHEPAGHYNPPPALTGDGFFAADARFGPFRFDNVEVARRAIWEMGETYPGSLGNWARELTELPALPARLADRGWYTLVEDAVYYKGTPESAEPEVGDLAVSFYELRNNYELSLVGAQSGESIAPWKASNGDEILLAAGGVRDARTMVQEEEAFSAGMTHTLRIAGLIGAVIGAAGMARWLVGFLGMIPVVGSLVSMSATIAGGLFGLMMGLLTIVVGWLAARPWIAAVILIAIGSAITYAIQQKRKADKAGKRSSRLAALNERARQMAAERLAGGGAMPALATAGGPAVPPPPPTPGKVPAASSAARASTTPAPSPPPPPVDEGPQELAPLEWTPGLISTTPPSVMPKAAPAPAAPAPAAPPALAAAAPRTPEPVRPSPPPAPTPAPEPEDHGGVIEFDLSGMDLSGLKARPAADPKPAPAPAAAAVTREVPPVPSPSQTAVTREVAPVPAPARPAPATPARPLFETVEAITPGAGLFETVAPRETVKPLFEGDALPDIELPSEQTTGPARPLAATRELPILTVPVAAPATPAPVTRTALGKTGDYQVIKVSRRHADGREELVCFELAKGSEVIARGSQDEIKAKLKALLGK